MIYISVPPLFYLYPLISYLQGHRMKLLVNYILRSHRVISEIPLEDMLGLRKGLKSLNDKDYGY